MNLLGTASTKTIKGEKRGFLTGILYMQPADMSGRNLCPGSSPGCRAACLYSAGRGAFSSVQAGRARKTALFLNDRERFMSLLVNDIEALIRRAAREGLEAVVRLNGTTDINWLTIAVQRNGRTFANVFEAFSDDAVRFYDYTKRPALARRPASSLPANYDLTFSRSETNDAIALEALENGHRVAVVFDTSKGRPLPETWNGRPVVDGDETDLRFLEPAGVVAGLRAKGRAKHDASGFVVAAS